MIKVSVQHKIGELAIAIEFRAEQNVTALFGPSGCGKTTLVRILADLTHPSFGQVIVGDRVLTDTVSHVNVPVEQRRMGYVFQDARLFPHLSVRANLEYGMKKLPNLSAASSFEEITSLLGLTSFLDRRPMSLSGGEKQRVAIGRALLSDPEVLLLDEPLASLDQAHKREILPYLRRLCRELQIPIIYVSHSVDEVIQLADTVVVMDDGKLTTHGTVEEVFGHHGVKLYGHNNETSTVFSGVVDSHDDTDHVTNLRTAAGLVRVPRSEMAIDSSVRVRVRARDVALALDCHTKTSVLNVFPGVIESVRDADVKGQMDIVVNIGIHLTAKVTLRSIRTLALEPGKKVYAMVKAVALE